MRLVVVQGTHSASGAHYTHTHGYIDGHTHTGARSAIRSLVSVCARSTTSGGGLDRCDLLVFIRARAQGRSAFKNKTRRVPRSGDAENTCGRSLYPPLPPASGRRTLPSPIIIIIIFNEFVFFFSFGLYPPPQPYIIFRGGRLFRFQRPPMRAFFLNAFLLIFKRFDVLYITTIKYIYT